MITIPSTDQLDGTDSRADDPRLISPREIRQLVAIARFARELVALLREVAELYRPISCGWSMDHEEPCTEFDALERALAVRVHAALAQIELGGGE